MWKYFFIIFCFIIQTLGTADAGSPWNKYQEYSKIHAVKIFREYLRIDTSHAENIKYAVDFWARQMSNLSIPYSIYKPVGLPIFVATIEGADPSLPSIMLNSHMDVVKVDASEWNYPPFDAYMDENGDIYARGSQDAKDVSIQYLEAIRKLKQDNVTLLRTVHITLMPDEEYSGYEGMKAFIKMQEFKLMNIGFALDEGLTNEGDFLTASYMDRRPWQMRFDIHGAGGHGFAMPENSAMAKTHRFINAVMSFRESQIRRLKQQHNLYPDHTSVNINIINGGLGINVIPAKVSLTVDMRLATDANVAEMDALINSWLIATGNTTQVTYYTKEIVSNKTAVDDSNPYWVTLRNTLNEMGIEIRPVVLPAVSDGRHLRSLGIPTIGFATKMRTISRLHSKNEYQNVETFLKGIDIYTKLIKNLVNMPVG